MAVERDMELRVQRLEQAVLGLGTGNGLLREVRSLRVDQAKSMREMERKTEAGFERLEKSMDKRDEAAEQERRLSKGQMVAFAIATLSVVGSILSALINAGPS